MVGTERMYSKTDWIGFHNGSFSEIRTHLRRVSVKFIHAKASAPEFRRG